MKNQTQYRWFLAWTGLGLTLAVLLLVNSVANYQFVSRRVLVDQVRRDLATQVATLDREINTRGPRTAGQISRLLEARDTDKIAWIQLRDDKGNVLAGAGEAVAPVFTLDYVRERFRERKASFKTLETKSGPVVVEAFPMRLPTVFSPTVFQAVADGGPTKPPRPGLIEIAAFLDASAGDLWPLQRNLLINSSAALALLVSIVLVALRFRAYLTGRHLEQQVEVARLVQRDLLPAGGHAPRDFDASADYLAANGVAGDFYDAFEATPDHAAFVLGDVSGKGVPAALLMGVIHGAVRSSSWTGSPHHHEEATARLNRLLCERASCDRFASMFWCYFDRETGLLQYINAGHLPPLLFKAEGGDPIRLDEGGPVLGLLARASYHQAAVRVDPGDVLVMYSDGLAESADARDEHFGEWRIAHAVRGALGLPVAEIRNRILASAEVFTRGKHPDDDRTLLVVRYTGAAEFSAV